MTKTKAYRKTNTKAQTQTKKNTKYFKDSIYVFLFFFGWAFKLLVSKQTLVSSGVAGLP